MLHVVRDSNSNCYDKTRQRQTYWKASLMSSASEGSAKMALTCSIVYPAPSTGNPTILCGTVRYLVRWEGKGEEGEEEEEEEERSRYQRRTMQSMWTELYNRGGPI